MQTTIATLLFVTSAVILACVVVDYAIVIFEQTLDTDSSPQIDPCERNRRHGPKPDGQSGKPHELIEPNRHSTNRTNASIIYQTNSRKRHRTSIKHSGHL